MCDIPMVCCPTRSPPSNAKAMVPRITQPPDVTGHKNLWLLPQDICGEVYSGFRITSGSKTDVMEFPWMALLAYSTSKYRSHWLHITLEHKESFTQWYYITSKNQTFYTVNKGVTNNLLHTRVYTICANRLYLLFLCLDI